VPLSSPQPPPGCDVCDGGANLDSLTLEFTSGFVLQHAQTDGTVQAVGDAGFLDMVDIQVADSNGNLVATFTSVFVGSNITVSKSAFGGSYPQSIKLTILDPASVHTTAPPATTACEGDACVALHTSCSQPLRVGDRFGNIRVTDFVNDMGATASTCASALALGCSACEIDSGDLVALTVAFRHTFAILHGQTDGKLEVVGNASGFAHVNVDVADKDGNIVQSFFNFAVDNTFPVTAAMFGKARLPSLVQITLFDPLNPRNTTTTSSAVNFAEQCTGVLCVRFRASCLQPLNVGNQFGNLVVEDFLTSEGRTQSNCIAPPPPSQCDSCESVGDKIASLTLRCVGFVCVSRHFAFV
jgi:hypothetical protein